MASGGRRGGFGTVDLSDYLRLEDRAEPGRLATIDTGTGKVFADQLPPTAPGGTALAGSQGGVPLSGPVNVFDLGFALTGTYDSATGTWHIAWQDPGGGGVQINALMSIAGFWQPNAANLAAIGQMTTGIAHRKRGPSIPYAGLLVPDKPGRLGGRRVLLPQVAANFTASGSATPSETTDDPELAGRALRCTFATGTGGTVKPIQPITPFMMQDPTTGKGRVIHLTFRVNRSGYAQSGGIRFDVSNDNFQSGNFSSVRCRLDQVWDNFTAELGAQGFNGMGRRCHHSYHRNVFTVGGGTGVDWTQPINSIRLFGAGNNLDPLDNTRGPLIVDWLRVDVQPQLLGKAILVPWMDDGLPETWLYWAHMMIPYGFAGTAAIIFPNVAQNNVNLSIPSLRVMAENGFGLGWHAWDNHDTPIAPGAPGVGDNLRQRFQQGQAWADALGFTAGVNDGAYAGAGGQGVHPKFDDQAKSARVFMESYRNNITALLNEVETFPVGDPWDLRAHMLDSTVKVFDGSITQQYLQNVIDQGGVGILTTHPGDWNGNSAFTSAMLAWLDARRDQIDVVPMHEARRIMAATT